ncbi:MAG TPA: DHA2 family efflux MFS transporter permease subunit [Dehalococcoidia bacterium]|nr:DHA2 family efflux MFS transporter permease subunit [Dehalococcoidia bacterium]
MSYPFRVLFCVLAGITMFTIDSTVVNVALAKLEAVYAVDVSTVQWVVTGYALASGIITPMADFFLSRWSMKRVWLTALAGFTAASMLCGVSSVFAILIAGRVLQGLSGGLLIPIGISSIFKVFPPERRGLALGFLAIPIVAGPALGPIMGGYIVSFLDWPLIFFINLPIGILAMALAALWLREEREGALLHLDLPGALLAAAGFTLILYAFTRVPDAGWASLTVEGLLMLGVLTLAVLVWHELRAREPLLEVRLFAIPQFVIGNVIGWTSTIALFGAEFLLPLYLQNLRGLPAFNAGLLLLPQGISTAVIGPIAGRLTDRLGVRPVTIFGFVLLAYNTWSLSHLTLYTPYLTLQAYLVLRGAALGFTLQSANLVALNAVPARFVTNASSLFTATRNVFQSLGIALLGSVQQTATITHTDELRRNVIPGSPGALMIQQIASEMLRNTPGLSQIAAQAQAGMVVLGQIEQQASVLAYGDAYRFTFYAALLAIGLSFFLPGRIAKPEGAEAMVAA